MGNTSNTSNTSNTGDLSGTVFLIGFMASGKTTVGRILSRTLGAAFIDTDNEIVKTEGKSIPQIFETYGEPYFRDLETKVLQKLMENSTGQRIVSVGGGLPVREENRRLMKEIGRTVYLTARIPTLKKRLDGGTGRPMLADSDLEERIRTLMDLRGDLYLDAADVCIATDELSPREVAKEIVDWMNI